MSTINAEVRVLFELQKYRDSLPSPMVDFNRNDLSEINRLKTGMAFYHWCIGQVAVGQKSYEELIDEEDCDEDNGELRGILTEDAEYPQIMEELQAVVLRYHAELIEMCKVTNTKDLHTVLDKIAVFENAAHRQITCHIQK